MTTIDFIAVAGLVLSITSLAVAVFALKETKKTNRIALLESRMRVYDAFHILAFEAIGGNPLSEETVEGFKSYASDASKLLPAKLADSIASFYSDCEQVVWLRTLKPPVDREYIDRTKVAAERIRRTALPLDYSFLSFIKPATDA
jgi:hypothetical protein